MKKYVYPFQKSFHTDYYQKSNEQKETSSFDNQTSNSNKETTKPTDTDHTQKHLLCTKVTHAKKNRQGMLQKIEPMEDLSTTIGRKETIHSGQRRSWERTQTI